MLFNSYKSLENKYTHPDPLLKLGLTLLRVDFRQCLIYDSNSTSARLIGVEYMIPRARYLTPPPPAEQTLWHSHVFEAKSGMLVLPYPSTHNDSRGRDKWDKLETQAMEEVVDWYGKIYHFWELDKGEELPLGEPKLMGSLTESKQLDVDQEMAGRNDKLGIEQGHKRELRRHIKADEIPEASDSWWKEAQMQRRGIYADA